MAQTPESRMTMSSMEPTKKGDSATKIHQKSKGQLKKDQNTFVTNIEAAAEAREVQWRTEIDKSHKTRRELLEAHSLSSKIKGEEISKGWRAAKETENPQELQGILTQQLQLCAELITNKKKLIDELQQDLKARDDSFVIDLKMQTEELQLMLERMTEQDNTLTKAYRQELEQWQKTAQAGEETKHTAEKTVWEEHMKKLLDTEMENLSKSQQAVEEYHAEISDMIFKNYDNFDIIRNKNFSDFQNQELEIHQEHQAESEIKLKIEKEKAINAKLKTDDRQLKAKLSSLKLELKKLQENEQTGKKKEKQLMEKKLKELNRKAQDYARLQKQRLHFALANTITFENTWLTLDAEAKELIERALHVDSMIYKQVLHMPWELPSLDPGKRWKKTCAASSAIVTQTETGDRDVEKFCSESEFEMVNTAEDSNVATPRTVKRLMELLCDKASFLLEVKMVKHLDTLDEKDQNIVKMGYLFNTLGIEEKHMPKLVDFLYKNGQQSPKESEDVKAGGLTHSTDEAESSSDLIDPNDVLSALKWFLDWSKHGSKTNMADQWRVQSAEVYNGFKDGAHWESLGNVIAPDKLKIWNMTKKKLESHHAVLSEISDLSREIQSLQQDNREMLEVCMLQQQVYIDQPPSAPM